MNTPKEYSRYMSDFRGIDATSEASNVALNRFAHVQNMYKDYKSGQGVAIETFPGTRTLLSELGGKVHGIHPFKATSGETYVVVHAGEKLYYYKHSERDKNDRTLLDVTMKDAKSSSFMYNNRLYIIDGQNYISVYEETSGEGENATVTLKAEHVDNDSAYVPTTFSNEAQYEQRNMLTDKFIEKTYVESLKEDTSSTSTNDLLVVEKNGGLSYGSDDPTEDKWILMCPYTWPNEYGVADVQSNYILSAIGNCASVLIRKDYRYDRADGLKKSDSFDLASVKLIRMDDTITSVKGTLDGYSNLSELYLSNNITELEESFFKDSNLTKIYLPSALKTLGVLAFEGCGFEGYENTQIYIYASNKKIIEEGDNKTSMYDTLVLDFKDITGDAKYSPIYRIPSHAKIVSYEEEFMTGVPSFVQEDNPNRFYIRTPCEEVTSVKIGEVEIKKISDDPKARTTYSEIKTFLNGKSYVTAIDLRCAEAKTVNNTLYIHGNAYPGEFKSVQDAAEEEEDKSIFGQHDYKGTAIEAIKGCTVCCTYDDRIFFTGNPELPNTVFYTHRDLTGHVNPTYVGVLNWFDDGAGNTPNVAMMANSTTLMVLKGNTVQDGSIYYHVGADGGNDLTPRIYPSTEGLAGLGCVGLAVNFRDDCVFMSNQGLEAVAKQTVNLERTIEHRSTNIDSLMLQSDLSKAQAAEWEGYLCILIDGKMYLADSRQIYQGIGGAIEYEWYYVEPVGGYDRDNDKYYLADYMPEEIKDYCARNKIFVNEIDEDRSVKYRDEDDSLLVKSKYSDKGTTIYYVERNGVLYLVMDNDGEMENGDLDNACAICAVEDVLYFGTANGKILCLNNDKRGTDKEEPDKSRIPTKWYNNSGHAYDAVAVLAMENAGVPHFTKSTVKRGTVLRLKSFPRSAFEVYATTDRTATTLLCKQSNSITTFDEWDFANLGLLTSDSGILAIKEKTKKWVEKQYMLIGKEYNKPWGLYSLAYRYIIAGGIKNQ